MKVRDWQDIISDVADADVDPDGWRAVGGDRSSGVGEDLYLGHPASGLFLLKTYPKNPFEVKGVGTQVARRVDEDIEAHLPTADEGRFAVNRPPADEDDARTKARRLESVLETHAEAPTSPADLFDDVMETLESPAYGPMTYEDNDRPGDLEALSKTFEDAEAV
ncbi:MAG: hypothetical protein ABEJ71_03785, partial [Halodesulfurarchaeum sp.]